MLVVVPEVVVVEVVFPEIPVDSGLLPPPVELVFADELELVSERLGPELHPKAIRQLSAKAGDKLLSFMFLTQ